MVPGSRAGRCYFAARGTLGPWQQIFYFEFDGRRDERLVLKVLGA